MAEIIRTNFAEHERYPSAILQPDSQMAEHMEAYTHVPKLVQTQNSQPNTFRIIAGHVPFATQDLLRGDYTTITLLRDPVARTISYLKHCKKYHAEHRDKNLEEIYDHEWYFKSFIENYQTKIFSMTQQECVQDVRLGDMTPPLPARADVYDPTQTPEAKPLLDAGAARLALELFSASTGVIEADSRRLEVAKENLSKASLVGVTERYEAFLAALNERFNWKITKVPTRNISEDGSVSAALKERITQDNHLDASLYEFATSIAP